MLPVHKIIILRFCKSSPKKRVNTLLMLLGWQYMCLSNTKGAKIQVKKSNSHIVFEAAKVVFCVCHSISTWESAVHGLREFRYVQASKWIATQTPSVCINQPILQTGKTGLSESENYGYASRNVRPMEKQDAMQSKNDKQSD